MSSSRGRSIGAVVAGVLFVIVVTMAVDFALHVAGVFPGIDQPLDDSLALLATAYRLVIGVAGGWITARLAPQSPPGTPMKLALVLGLIGLLLGIVGVVTTWNLGLGPRWYPIALAVLAVPQSWAGAKLYEMNRGSGL